MRSALGWRFARVDRSRRSLRRTGRPWRSTRPPTATRARFAPPERSAGRLRATVACAVLLGFAAGTACRRKTGAGVDTPPRRRGEATVHYEGGDAAIDEAGLAQRLRAQLAGSGLVTAAADAGTGVPTVRLLGRLATEIEEAARKGLCRAVVSLSITTRPTAAPGALNVEISVGGVV